MKSKRLATKLKQKYNSLKEKIGNYPNLLVAYSGGVDSALLLKIAVDQLDSRAIGIIGVSPSLPERELKEAKQIADKFHLPTVLIETHEIESEDYSCNPVDRCYFCKKELFSEIYDYGRQHNYKYIADGTNLDDSGDYRPGRRAAEELKVVSPLKDAGLTKQDIRLLSQFLGLPTWDKPALACLASRFPTGTRITTEALKQVEQAEDYLHNLGFRVFRVRHHEQLARIEVGQSEINKFIREEIREKIYHKFREIGYNFVTLDLLGYRQGSLNEI